VRRTRIDTLLELIRTNATALYVVAFVLLGGVLPLLFLRLPLHFDEGIFLVVGDQWADGVPLYAGITDHKPPAIFFLVYLAESVVEYPHFLLRGLTYLTVAVTGVLLFHLGRELAGRTLGMVASLVYLTATYMPHFDGYFFITEPYSNLAIVLAAVLLLEDRPALDVLAGAAMAVGVLFNQTVFLFGLAFVVFHALLLRDPEHRNRGYLLETLVRFLVIGTGFLVPVGLTAAYFYANGLLRELFYYAFYLPLTGYSPPFQLYGHLLAAASLLPAWLLVLGVVAQEGWRLVQGTTRNEGVLFVVCWAFFVGYPGATTFAGDHKLLFTFPAVGLLTAIGLQRVYRAFEDADGTIAVGLTPRRVGAGSVSLLTVVLTGLVLVTAASTGVNAYYASNVLSSDISDERASVDEIAPYVDDGGVYTYPEPQSMVYYHNDSITPVDTFVSVYDETTRKEVVSDLERQQTPYLVVRDNHVAPNGSIYRTKDLYFKDHKAELVDYLNANYEPFTETDTWVVFRRV